MENALVIASRKSRVFAYIIDYFVLNFVILGPLIMLMVMAGEKGKNGLLFFSIFGGIILFFLIYAFKDANKGQSIGKWLLGIAVREQENHNVIPSLSKLFLRNLTHVLGFIEFIFLAVNKNKQRLGDQLAKTVVIKTKEMSVWKKIVFILSAIVISFAIMIVLLVVMFKSSDAYKVSEEYLLQDDNIIRETGGIEGFGLFPTGSIQTSNGSGEALFTIKVKGKERDIYVDVYLTKEPREDWYIQEAQYYE